MFTRALVACVLGLSVQACAVEVETATTEEEEIVPEENASYPTTYDDGGADEATPGACANARPLRTGAPERGTAAPPEWQGPHHRDLVVPVECIEEPYFYRGDPWQETEAEH